MSPPKICTRYREIQGDIARCSEMWGEPVEHLGNALADAHRARRCDELLEVGVRRGQRLDGRRALLLALLLALRAGVLAALVRLPDDGGRCAGAELVQALQAEQELHHRALDTSQHRRRLGAARFPTVL